MSSGLKLRCRTTAIHVTWMVPCKQNKHSESSSFLIPKLPHNRALKIRRKHKYLQRYTSLLNKQEESGSCGPTMQVRTPPPLHSPAKWKTEKKEEKQQRWLLHQPWNLLPDHFDKHKQGSEQTRNYQTNPFVWQDWIIQAHAQGWDEINWTVHNSKLFLPPTSITTHQLAYESSHFCTIQTVNSTWWLTVWTACFTAGLACRYQSLQTLTNIQHRGGAQSSAELCPGKGYNLLGSNTTTKERCADGSVKCVVGLHEQWKLGRDWKTMTTSNRWYHLGCAWRCLLASWQHMYERIFLGQCFDGCSVLDNAKGDQDWDYRYSLSTCYTEHFVLSLLPFSAGKAKWKVRCFCSSTETGHQEMSSHNAEF